MFVEKLRVAMAERGMRQKELAAASGLSKSGISQYLSGKVVPNKLGLKKLADALEVAPEFFGGTTENCPEPPDSQGIKNITIDEAARLLGKSRQFVRVSLQSGKAPFGWAVKGAGEKYSYHISPKKFYDYIGGATA